MPASPASCRTRSSPTTTSSRAGTRPPASRRPRRSAGSSSRPTRPTRGNHRATPPMADDDLRIEDDPRREDVAILDERLYEFNAAASGVDDGRSLAIFVRDGDGTIVAGMHGWTWGGTGFVQAV